MKKQDKIDPVDWSKVPVDPDPNFSADHNRRVIENTIKKNEAVRRKKGREQDEAARERAAAVAQYLKSLEMGGNSSIEKYFGKSELARLRGREILDKVKKAYAKKQKKSPKEEILPFRPR